jgi:hypothetical protein
MTTNHGYETPEKGTLDWHLPLNRNFTRLDTDIEIRDSESELGQYVPKNGAKFLATDTGARYLGNGTEWIEAPAQPIEQFVIPKHEDRPASPREGQIWYRADLDEVRVQAGDSIITIAKPSETTGAGPEPIWATSFEDPAPEAMKSPSSRNTSQLQEELRARGWTGRVNNWVDNHLFYTNTAPTSNTATRKGNHALEFRYPRNERMGFDIRRNVGVDEAWAQYWLMFEDGFDVTDNDFASWADGGKFPGWHMTPNPGSTDGAKAWGTFHDPDREGYRSHDRTGKIHLNYYVEEVPDSSPGTEPYNSNGIINSGRWYEITQYARMNDEGKRNGALRAWVNGTKAFDSSGYYFRKDASTKLTWSHISHFGGGWYSPKTQSMFTDDLRIYTENPL